MRPSDRELVAAVPIQEISRTLVREWAMIVVTALAALPAPVLRVLDVTGLADPGLPDPVNAVIFGAGIFAAATLLTALRTAIHLDRQSVAPATITLIENA